jgi:HTH-type transcriptional regulator/antitoxin HigA
MLREFNAIDCTNHLWLAMAIFPIKSPQEYRRALKQIDSLMGARRQTPEGDQLDALVMLVEAWERKHYPLDPPDPAIN